jgi:hypothetical protein
MVGLADVRRWNAGQVEDVLRTVQQHQQILVHSGDDFLAALPVDGWQGAAADNALAGHRGLGTGLDHRVAGVAAIAKRLAQVGDAIPAVQREIANADDLATRYGYRLGDDGRIADTLTDPGPNDPSPEDRQRVKVELADMVAAALRTAADIDNGLASVLKQAAGGQFGTGTETTVQAAAADGAKGPGDVPSAPPTNGTPSQNAAWWDSLSPAGQATLLSDHPDWLGNLDGLPGSVRDKANRARIPEVRTDLQQQLDAARSTLRKDEDDPLRWLNLIQDKEKVSQLQAKLSSLDTVGQVIDQQPPRQLLTLDMSGKRAQAVVAVGDVDTAEHVAVFTPGFTTTVNGSLGSYDSGMAQLRSEAQQLANSNGDGGQVATVTWLGYDTPQVSEIGDVIDGNSVASDHAAKVGAVKLDGFLNGLGASHDAGNTPLQLTALGHSYGSLTTGIALQHATPVDDAVVFGSPGMDINSSNQLQVPAGHVYAMRAPDDPVPDLDIADVFGVSPYRVPGIDQLATGAATSVDGQPLSASTGHSQYLTNHTTSQYNIAAVVAGQPGLRITDHDSHA